MLQVEEEEGATGAALLTILTTTTLMSSRSPPEAIVSRMMMVVNAQPDFVPGYEHLKKNGKWYYRDGTSCDASGVRNSCFYNVYQQKEKGVACYGFAMCAQLLVPLSHAWRVDSLGDVVELTPNWKSATWYFGVEINENAVTKLVSEKTPAQYDVLHATQWSRTTPLHVSPDQEGERDVCL